MHELYQTYASGDLRSNPGAVFKMAAQGPVVIMQRATPSAVMVSPEQWNRTARELSKLRTIVEAMEILKRDEETISLGDLCTELDLDPRQLTTSATMED